MDIGGGSCCVAPAGLHIAFYGLPWLPRVPRPLALGAGVGFCRSASQGLLWRPMVSDGINRHPAPGTLSAGVGRPCWTSYGYQWLRMASCGLPWPAMASRPAGLGCLCRLLPFGPLWASTACNGLPRVPLPLAPCLLCLGPPVNPHGFVRIAPGVDRAGSVRWHCFLLLKKTCK